MNKLIIVLGFIIFVGTLQAQNSSYILQSGFCEGSDGTAAKHPVFLKLNTQNGEAWALIRLREYPYTYYWEKVVDSKASLASSKSP